jgi:hypothetical protein
METDRETAEEHWEDDLPIEELLDCVTEDCDNFAKERGTLILERQEMGTDREAITEDLDDTALLEEK